MLRSVLIFIQIILNLSLKIGLLEFTVTEIEGQNLWRLSNKIVKNRFISELNRQNPFIDVNLVISWKDLIFQDLSASVHLSVCQTRIETRLTELVCEFYI